MSIFINYSSVYWKKNKYVIWSCMKEWNFSEIVTSTVDTFISLFRLYAALSSMKVQWSFNHSLSFFLTTILLGWLGWENVFDLWLPKKLPWLNEDWILGLLEHSLIFYYTTLPYNAVLSLSKCTEIIGQEEVLS